MPQYLIFLPVLRVLSRACRSASLEGLVLPPSPGAQSGETVSIHFSKGGKRMRGVAKPKGFKDTCSLPQNCNAGDLAEVLEFVHVSSKQASHAYSKAGL